MAAFLPRAFRRLTPRLGSRLLSTELSTPSKLRLEPQLEKVISRFESSIKAGHRGREEKAKSLVDDFGLLQRFRVQKVLLVCSDYDSYTFEEEGCARASAPRRSERPRFLIRWCVVVLPLPLAVSLMSS